MKLLVIGAGGREHAMAWKLAQSIRVSKVYVAPGNAGTALEEGVENIDLADHAELIEFARREKIAFTVVGPEAPLAAGLVDDFRAAGLKIFGPTRSAAQLESSKGYAKAFMVRHGIATARYQTFSDVAAAHRYAEAQGAPIVIKADGLAAGKGVVVASDIEQAHHAIDAMLVENTMGPAGKHIVIEDLLEGEEASFIAMVDGKNALALASSQDHKRLNDADLGPNTGGMGAYSPARVVTPRVHAKVMREVIQPAINGMEREGNAFTGFLYAGLMISKDGQVQVLEFNCRMGDPETQPILLRLKSDFAELIEHALNRTLGTVEAQWDTRSALGVVLAAHGYPAAPRTGDEIKGIPANGDDYHVFHSGTVLDRERLVVNGGRVLCVTALAHNIKTAQRRAYEIADQIGYDGKQMRRDIGARSLRAGALLTANRGPGVNRG